MRQPSHVLSLAHPPGAEAERAIRDLIAACKTRFRQEAVLRVKWTACILL